MGSDCSAAALTLSSARSLCRGRVMKVKTIHRRQDTVRQDDEVGDLLARTALGDQEAFRCLYEVAGPRLYGQLLQLLRSHSVAEEVLHECFVNIWRKADTYNPSLSQPMTWMSSIARHKAVDFIRSTPDYKTNFELETYFTTDADQTPGPLDQLIASVESRTLRDCFKHLDINSRHSIAAAFYRGLTHEQISTELDKPLGTIKSWIRRGLEQLRLCIDAAQGE